MVLVGPSGCGKSTTLKMINRLIEPTTGRIFIDGQDVTTVDAVKLRRGIGYVIQQIGLFPHQKILRNVMTVPLLYGESTATAKERARELMDLVGLDPATYGDRYPHQLSGGQRQRVGVARALAADPPVLLMDEPFGAVDPVVRIRLQEEFLRLQRDLGKTVVLVTHDIDEAVKMGDRVAVFATGGRLAQFGTPAELLAHPADEFVEDFVGATRGLRRLTVTPHRPRPPRAARRRHHRRPRQRDRRRRHPRGGAGRDAPRRQGASSASRTAPSSSASSPPPASTASCGRPCAERRDARRCVRRSRARCNARTCQGSRPLDRRVATEPVRPALRDRRASQAVSSARTASSSALATSSSASSSATRRIASAARVSASSRRRARVSPSASARSARLASALSLRRRLGGPALGRGQGDLELLDGGLVCGHLLLHAGDVRRVLGGALGREVAEGLSLLGPVAVGVATGLHQLGVGDPDGGRAEGDAEEGGGREETPRTGQDGAENGGRREDDKGDSDGEPGAALPTTSLGGRHEVRLGGVLVLSGRDTHAPAAAP